MFVNTTKCSLRQESKAERLILQSLCIREERIYLAGFNCHILRSHVEDTSRIDLIKRTCMQVERAVISGTRMP